MMVIIYQVGFLIVSCNCQFSIGKYKIIHEKFSQKNFVIVKRNIDKSYFI